MTMNPGESPPFHSPHPNSHSQPALFANVDVMPSNHNLNRILSFVLAPRSVLIFFFALFIVHNRTLIIAILFILPKILCWALFLYLFSIPFSELYKQAHEMSFSGQPPYTYLYANQPPPVPQAGHFLIGPPPFRAPQGHQWIAVPPIVAPPAPATWRLDPDLTVNGRGEHVTAQGEIFRIPVPRPGSLPVVAPQGSPPLMPLPPHSPTGPYPATPQLWGIFPHPPFQGGPPRPSSTPAPAAASPATSSSPSASPPPPSISRQNPQGLKTTAPTTLPPISPTPRPRTQSQSRSQEQCQPIHFRHVHFLDGDNIIPAGAHSRPSSRYRTPLDPQAGTLETGPPMRGRSTTASAFTERELPETRGRARSRPAMTRVRTRTPSPYPTRMKSSPRETETTPHTIPERTRAPYGGIGRDTNLTFSSGPNDSVNTSMTGSLNNPDGDSDTEYPKWPECELCEQTPATKKLGRDRQIDACDTCFIDALRAEHGIRTAGSRE